MSIQNSLDPTVWRKRCEELTRDNPAIKLACPEKKAIAIKRVFDEEIKALDPAHINSAITIAKNYGYQSTAN